MKKLLILFTLILPLTVSSQNADDSANDQNLKVKTYSDESEGLSSRVDIDADDAFLPAVLKTLSEISGYNIVTGPEVNRQQRISIHVLNVPVEEAINLVVRATGLSYEIVGNSFLVTHADNLQQEVGITSHLIELQYARAEEMKELLKNLTQNIQVVESKNALLISTSPKIIGEIRDVVKKLDVPSKQVVLQTRVIEVQVDKVKQLGIDWEKLSKLTTILAERPVDPLTGLGIDSKDFIGDTKLGELPSDHTFQMVDGLDDVGYFDRQLTAFDITLDFLLKTNTAKLLTDTKLTTMNNRKASIHIGEVIPFIVKSTESAHVEREKVGITVEITPQINRDSLITAVVKPEASTIIEMINGSLPRRKVRTAETTVLVKDRQKIIIAGLMSTEDQMDVQSVPFLGDIPYVGKIFQHYSTKEVQTDLIIEITPYIITKDTEQAKALQDSLFTEDNPIEKYEKEQEKKLQEGGYSIFPEPSHLCFLPSTDVLKRGQYIIGFREISIGYNERIQVMASPWYPVGRVQAGLKILLSPNAAMGIGYHYGMSPADDKYNLKSRVGLYAVNSFIKNRFFNLTVELDGQFGKYQSIGGGLGLTAGPEDVICLVADISQNYTPKTPDGEDYWDPWLAGALRATIPSKTLVQLEAGVAVTGKNYLEDPIINSVDDYKFVVYGNLSLLGFFREKR